MALLSQLRVWVGATAIPLNHIWYAGLTPGFSGLYQINLLLPDTLDPDPEIRASVGDQLSPPGLKLATTGLAPQPTLAGLR